MPIPAPRLSIATPIAMPMARPVAIGASFFQPRMATPPHGLQDANQSRAEWFGLDEDEPSRAKRRP